MRLITKAELRAIVPYTPQHILRLEKRGLFPRRIQVGPNRVAWLLSEIEAWVKARVAERDCLVR
jgi:prophage regulatory protein